MSFPPPPPPPPVPPGQASHYPPQPGGALRQTLAPPNANNALVQGVNNLHLSTPGTMHNHPYGLHAPTPPIQRRYFPTPPLMHNFAPPPPPTPRSNVVQPPLLNPGMQYQHQPPPPSPYLGAGAPSFPSQHPQAPPPPQQPSLHQQCGFSARPSPPPLPTANGGYSSGYPQPPAPPRPTAPMIQPPFPGAGFQCHISQPLPPQPNNASASAYNRPGPPRPGQHPSAQQSQQQHQPKIDPAQIPRPPIFTRPNDNGPLPIYLPKAAASQTRVGPPPPADSRYLVHDDGNASPQLLRSNLYTIPSDRSTWQKLGEPDMGLICSPMALASQDYIPTLGPQLDSENEDGITLAPLDPQRIPLVQAVPGSNGFSTSPPRCRSCAAYVNPYWNTDTNTCNFCGSRNTNLDFDVLCLQKGTVDYAVDGPYITRKSPVQPIFLYALDLTCSHLLEYVEILQQVGSDLGRHFQQQPVYQAMHEQGGNCDPANPSDPNVSLLQQRPRIGLCFVASFGVVVITRNGPKGTPLAMVMPDVTVDPFCHAPLTEWTFDLSTMKGVDQWTRHIQTDLLLGGFLKGLRKDAGKKNAYGLDGFELSCGGAAMAFCADALAESGGRATWISSRRPNFGVGYVRHRSPSMQSGIPLSFDETLPVQNLQNPKNNEDELSGAFYRRLQETCSKARVVLDIVIHSDPQHVAHQQLELATHGELCRATSGRLTWISAPGIGWKEPLAEELKRPLLCFQGWDAVLKLRCSSGLQVKNYVAHPGTISDGGGLAASPEIEVSCVTPQTNVAVLIEHKIGGMPKNQTFAFVQSALLFSTQSGQRRVRVSTLALRPSTSIPDIFLAFDFTAHTTLLLRRAISLLTPATNNVVKDMIAQLSDSKAKDDSTILHQHARDDILEQVIKLLVSYRKHTNAINSPSGQLILPERLQLLPLFVMCLLKSPMLRRSIVRRAGNSAVLSPTNNERAYYAFQAMMVGPASAFLLVHPNIFDLNKPAPGVGDWRKPQGRESALSELSKASYHSCIQLPHTVSASMTCLQDSCVYLVDNGLVIYLVFGKDVSHETKNELSSPVFAASETLTNYGRLLRRIVWQLRSFCSVCSDGSRSEVRPTFAPVISVWLGNQGHLMLEQDLMNCMVDDPSAGEKDYTEFLVKVHRMIREKIEPKKSA